jgi:class 3 adenylate cyclase
MRPVSESIELATILVTDLVGSTRLATSVGPVRADQLRDEHFEVLREAIRAFGGHEFRSTGDGMMVAFRSASAAVARRRPVIRWHRACEVLEAIAWSR